MAKTLMEVFDEDGDNDESRDMFNFIYVPDPVNLGKFIEFKHEKHSHFKEGRCDYCRSVYFDRDNCPNCGAPREKL